MSLTIDTPVAVQERSAAGGLREVVTLALPVILTNLSATLMMTTDAAMVGRLGATELGAVGYAGIWYWTALSLFSGAATGVQTFVSQAHGRGDAAQCGRWAWQGLYAVVPLAALGIAAFALGFGPLLSRALAGAGAGAAGGGVGPHARLRRRRHHHRDGAERRSSAASAIRASRSTPW